jgi:hypothetical protein
MPAPFPGMNPWLEGYLWPDLHQTLAHKVRQLLVPQLQPKYFASLQTTVYLDYAPEQEIGILYPDIEVRHKRAEEPPADYGSSISPVTVTAPFPKVEWRLPSIEIRDREHQQMVAIIEILSPINKKAPGLDQYREKRLKLHQAGVHLLEIDLLRRGKRLSTQTLVEQADYLVSLTRAQQDMTQYWTFQLQEKMPVVPVPLLREDEDVVLHLQTAFDQAFEEAGYTYSIDYKKVPPPPAFTPEQERWINERLGKQ